MARRSDVGGFRCVVAVFGAVSPDGIHWTSLPEPLMIQHADTLNTCYYDVDRRAVRGLRPRVAGQPQSAGHGGREPRQLDRRRAALDRPGGQQRFPPFRQARDRRLDRRRHAAEPSLLHQRQDDAAGHPRQPRDVPLDLGTGERRRLDLAVVQRRRRGAGRACPAGRSWRRACPARATAGTSSSAAICSSIPATVGASPTAATRFRTSTPAATSRSARASSPACRASSGMATWPKGRLVALECDDEGRFATVAVVPPGDRIRLNASVKPTGYIKVAVQRFGQGDVPGRSFDDADRLVGDGLALPVTWRGERLAQARRCAGDPPLPAPAGEAVRSRVLLMHGGE